MLHAGATSAKAEFFDIFHDGLGVSCTNDLPIHKDMTDICLNIVEDMTRMCDDDCRAFTQLNRSIFLEYLVAVLLSEAWLS